MLDLLQQARVCSASAAGIQLDNFTSYGRLRDAVYFFAEASLGP